MPDLSADTVAQIVANIAIGAIAVVGSIRGGILGAREGASASLAATKAYAEESEQRQRASVRLRLSLEIDHNLTSLRELQAKLIAAATRKPRDAEANEGEPVVSWESYARSLVHGAMPAWTREAWVGMTAVNSPALDAKEIAQTNNFYGQLETISGIREQLTNMLNERPRTVDFGPMMGEKSMEPLTFHFEAPGLASQVNEIISKLLTTGNPIVES